MIYLHFLGNKTVRMSNDMIELVILLYVESWHFIVLILWCRGLLVLFLFSFLWMFLKNYWVTCYSPSLMHEIFFAFLYLVIY